MDACSVTVRLDSNDWSCSDVSPVVEVIAVGEVIWDVTDGLSIWTDGMFISRPLTDLV